MVTVVHWYNRLSLKASEVQCFVDGKFVSSQQLPFPHTPANEVSTLLGIISAGEGGGVLVDTHI